MGLSRSVSHLLRSIRPAFAFAFFLASFVFGFGCAPPFEDSPPSNGPIPQTPEAAYYGTPTVYSGTTSVITGTATFNRYDDTGVSGLNSITTGHPIRFAEVHILNSAGERIQQGETDGSGNISMIIPRTAGNYTLRVNSRADNSQLKVSVLNNPYDQVYYSHDTAFALATEASLAVSIAGASATNTSNLHGAAFNILDQAYIANEYLRNNANTACGAVGCGSTPFTVAPKIAFYWSKGVSPGTYFGSPSSRISFFTNVSSGNIYRGLYILGGVQGEICTDTDHFDRSVVLHEYGHYLEAAYGKSSSPGGSHDGNSVIDPRLAWSEGWADYFQAIVLGRIYYRDTTSNSACSGGAMLSFNDFSMEAQNADVPTQGEGVFREMSVARNLYDITTSSAGGDGFGANLGFTVVWHAFKAMGASFKLQNAGQFNQLVYGYAQTLGDGTQIANLGDYDAPVTHPGSGVLGNEKQNRTQRLYGQHLTIQSSSCTYSFAPTPISLAPQPDVVDGSGAVLYSDFLRNNHFYRYDYDGNIANAYVTMNYSASGSPYDLDLYVYNENYTYLDGSTLSKYSVRSQPESGAPNAQSGTESIDLANRPAGTYVINVKVDYSVPKAATTYYLQLNSGQRLCP